MPNPSNESVAKFSRAYVAELAPKELSLFRAISNAYFKDPDEVFRSHKQGGVMAFGDASLATAITPFVLAVVQAVIAYAIQEMLKKGIREPEASFALATPSQTRDYRARLLGQMVGAFSLEEIKTLCFNLGFEYDNVSNAEKEPFARDLIAYCEKRDALESLLVLCEAARPNATFRRAQTNQAASMSWTSDQLKRMRDIVTSTAQKLKVPDPTGSDLADQLVLSFVMA